MKITRLTRGFLALGLFGASVLAGYAGYPEFEDVQARRGDPSPNKFESNINDYTHQDEQLNLKPDDGQVRVMRTDQKNLVNDFQTELIPLRYATPREIRNVMRVVTGIEGGRAETVVDKNG